MAELILRIGTPIKVVSKNLILISACYYLGRGFIIDNFLPYTLEHNLECSISHLTDYGNGGKDIKIYPLENMDKSTFHKAEHLPRYRNSVGEFLTSEDDFKLSNLRDFDLIDDCHLNDFAWFEKIKKIIAEKLANNKYSL